jgi:AcrR family transcriptional regulator
MTAGELFDAGDGDTEEALMAATYRALCEHGYADITIEDIGEEFEKSTSLLYHHYDGKDDLLVAFLGYMLERFEDDVPFEEEGDSWTKLQGLLDHALAPTLETEREEFTRAMVELRAQAAHTAAYRAAFTRHDRFFRDRLTAIVSEGVEAGAFHDVDPTAVAALVQTVFIGAMTRRGTTDDVGASLAATRDELDVALDTRLRREGQR